MSGESLIEWTDKTWNPVTGCSPVGPACEHCWAAKFAGTRARHLQRYKGLSVAILDGHPICRRYQFVGDVRCHEDLLARPLGWRKPARIAVSMHGDLFHEKVPNEFIWRVLEVMALCPQHTFQVLTKRPLRALQLLSKGPSGGTWELAGFCSPVTAAELKKRGKIFVEVPWPLPNVWLGASPWDQDSADEMTPLLLRTPAALHFLSIEPMLGPITILRTGLKLGDEVSGRLDWVILGGETGPGARKMERDWAEDVAKLCQVAGRPCFFKQAGTAADWDAGDLLKLRQFPAARQGAPA